MNKGSLVETSKTPFCNKQGEAPQSIAGNHRAYLSFMLRLWGTHRDGRFEWWASLESPVSGERFHFTSLPSLYAYLEEQTR